MALLLIGCGGGPRPGAAAQPAPATPVPAPTRDPALDGRPLVAVVNLGASDHTFQGGDDHVGLVIDNRGRDIQDLVVQSPGWLAEHGLGMGTTRACGDVDLAAGSVDCGPVYAGQTASLILRGFPEHVGTFHYELRLADREPGGLLPIQDPEGHPVVLAFDEVVDQVTNQIPGGNTAQPSPSPTP